MEKRAEVLSEDGSTIAYEFKLEEGADVCRMLIRAADYSKIKDADHHVATVLMAQADMIEQGLHLTDDLNAPDMMGDIEKFHQKFGLEYTGKPRMLEPELFQFRFGFMHEELEEWQGEQTDLIEALTADDGKPEHRRITMGLHQQLDALVDLCYVALGTAYLQFGRRIFNDAWHRVQAANMAKVRCEREGDSKRGSTFDVIKPEGWTPPDHHDLVKDHAHVIYRHPGEKGADVRSDTQVVPTAQ